MLSIQKQIQNTQNATEGLLTIFFFPTSGTILKVFLFCSLFYIVLKLVYIFR